jgi:shikimate kinase
MPAKTYGTRPVFPDKYIWFTRHAGTMAGTAGTSREKNDPARAGQPGVPGIPRDGDRLNNIVLTGMPGAGKSTAGVILAKTLGMKFIDTDIAIQEREGRLLQEIIDTEGPDRFLEIEQDTVLSLRCHDTVIATGGSVVLSRRAMEHLKQDGVVVYLKISLEEMEQRLGNITTRGIVLHAGEGLPSLYSGRVPFYGKYADITVDCSGMDAETVVTTIVREVSGLSDRRTQKTGETRGGPADPQKDEPAGTMDGP